MVAIRVSKVLLFYTMKNENETSPRLRQQFASCFAPCSNSPPCTPPPASPPGVYHSLHQLSFSPLPPPPPCLPPSLLPSSRLLHCLPHTNTPSSHDHTQRPRLPARGIQHLNGQKTRLRLGHPDPFALPWAWHHRRLYVGPACYSSGSSPYVLGELSLASRPSHTLLLTALALPLPLAHCSCSPSPSCSLLLLSLSLLLSALALPLPLALCSCSLLLPTILCLP
jgi:hypothetical protein